MKVTVGGQIEIGGRTARVTPASVQRRLADAARLLTEAGQVSALLLGPRDVRPAQRAGYVTISRRAEDRILRAAEEARRRKEEEERAAAEEMRRQFAAEAVELVRAAAPEAVSEYLAAPPERRVVVRRLMWPDRGTRLIAARTAPALDGMGIDWIDLEAIRSAAAGECEAFSALRPAVAEAILSASPRPADDEEMRLALRVAAVSPRPEAVSEAIRCYREEEAARQRAEDEAAYAAWCARQEERLRKLRERVAALPHAELAAAALAYLDRATSLEGASALALDVEGLFSRALHRLRSLPLEEACAEVWRRHGATLWDDMDRRIGLFAPLESSDTFLGSESWRGDD